MSETRLRNPESHTVSGWMDRATELDVEVGRLTRERDEAVALYRGAVSALCTLQRQYEAALSERDMLKRMDIVERGRAVRLEMEVATLRDQHDEDLQELVSAASELNTLRALLRRCEPIIAAHDALAPPDDTLLADVRSALEPQ